ncbi:MAG: hypothetical protein U5K55_02660 [Aliarcobacter sp.]|nr:hypothetical protein [Aliarcobacter sp.]
MPYLAASLMVVGFLVLWGYEERVREFIRKPFFDFITICTQMESELQMYLI